MVCYQLHHAAIVQTLTALGLSSKRERGECENVQKCDCGFDPAVAAPTVVRGRPRRGSGQTRNAKEYRVFKGESFRERWGEDFGGRALFQ